MITTKLSTKGQITIPKSIRASLGWQEGLEFVILETENGVLLKPLPLLKKSSLDEVLGSTGYEGPPKSLAEMEEAIAAGVRDSQ